MSQDATRASAPLSGRKAIVLGWDGADWRLVKPLVDAGRLPNLARLLATGSAADLAAFHPIISPTLWTSAATGKPPLAHGILGFFEPDTDPLGPGLRPSASISRAGKAFWNILCQVGLRTHLVGWRATHPAEPMNGVVVSDLHAQAVAPLDQPWPPPPDAVHPRELAEELADLRVHPGEITLSDLRAYVPSIGEFDPASEPALAMLATRLAETASHHSAATYILENHEWDCLAVRYPLLGHLCHAFLDCHPPRAAGVSEEKARRFHRVITAACELLDQMLGVVLAHADEQTAVILLSDHGFYRAPADAAEPATGEGDRRPLGLAALRAPGVRAGEWFFGAGILDLAPTLLTHFGLPIGADMRGRPWTRTFSPPPRVTTVPSWEAIDGPHPSGQHQPARRAASEVAAEADPFAALPAPARAAAEGCVRELRFHRALHLLAARRPAEALPLLEASCAATPDRIDAHLHRLSALHALGRFDAALALAAELEDPAHPARRAFAGDERSAPRFDLVRGVIALAQNRPADALAHLLRARDDATAPRAEMHLQLGRVYLRLRRWPDAEVSFARSLAVEPDQTEARAGRAAALYRLRRWADAEAAALHALETGPAHFLAHYVLGLAYARQGHPEQARFALGATLQAAPGFAPAHRVLAWILRKDPSQNAFVALHRAAARIGTPPALDSRQPYA